MTPTYKSERENRNAKEACAEDAFGEGAFAGAGVDQGGVVFGAGDLCGEAEDWHADYRPSFWCQVVIKERNGIRGLHSRAARTP